MDIIYVTSEDKVRIDKYLSEETEYSRSMIQKMLEEESIILNGKKAKTSTKVKDGDKIEILGEHQEERNIEAENIPLDIVFEDENVLLINKPSGLVVHPGSGNRSHTMVNGLMYYTNYLSDVNGEVRPGIVHRIDKDTSGLILVAKNNEAHQILAEDFKNKNIERKYIALVCGVLKNNHIVIDAPIGRDEKNRKKMTVHESGKSAVTHVFVLKRYQKYTLVECVLETGRTHQIRVHLKYIGYPLFNDPLYHKEVIPSFGQFLHSSEITFTEPITKEVLHFKVPLPYIFQKFLLKLDKEENEEN